MPRDYSRYDVTIRGKQYPMQFKRKMVQLLVMEVSAIIPAAYSPGCESNALPIWTFETARSF